MMRQRRLSGLGIRLDQPHEIAHGPDERLPKLPTARTCIIELFDYEFRKDATARQAMVLVRVAKRATAFVIDIITTNKSAAAHAWRCQSAYGDDANL